MFRSDRSLGLILTALFVWAFAAAVFTAAAVLLMWLIGTGQMALFWGYLIVFLVLGGLWLYKSAFKLSQSEMMETYLFGTHWATYLSGSLLEEMDDDQKARMSQLTRCILGGMIPLGIFPDLLFLPWPFWRTYRASTTGQKVALHAGRGASREDKSSRDPLKHQPEVWIEANPTVQVLFLSIRRLLTRMTIKPSDLTERCQIGMPGTETEITVSEGATKVVQEKYEGSRLAAILLDHTQELVTEAFRKAAKYFTWTGDFDIKKDKRLLEIAMLFELAEPGSILQQAGILHRPAGREELPMKGKVLDREKLRNWKLANFYTKYVLAVDVNIEDIFFMQSSPNASEVEKAINDPLLGLLEASKRIAGAEATRIELAKDGQGRAEAMEKIRTALKLSDDADSARLLLILEDFLKNREIKLNTFSEGIQDTIQSLVNR